MVNDNAKNCWEYWGCPKEVRKGCPTFQGDMGDFCWLLGSTYQKENCPFHKTGKGILDCIHCPWFQKLNPAFAESGTAPCWKKS